MLRPCRQSDSRHLRINRMILTARGGNQHNFSSSQMSRQYWDDAVGIWAQDPVKTITKNALQNGYFLKPAAFRLRMDRQKRRLRMLCEGFYRNFHRFSVFVWTGENDCEYATCGLAFLRKRRKKCPFSKSSRYVWKGPNRAINFI